MRNIYTTIKTIRKEKGLSQKQMAEHLGMEQTSYSKIERGDVTINIERLYQMAEAFGMEAEDLLIAGKDNKTKCSKGNISYVPVKAQAGYLSELVDEQKAQHVSFSVPLFRDEELYMIDVEGDSMKPTVKHGDYVIIKSMANRLELKYGIPYVIESFSEGRVLKRIYKNNDPEKYTLVSDNNMYEPFDIQKSDIDSIWEIKGFMSKNVFA